MNHIDGNLAYKLDCSSDLYWEEVIDGKVVMMAPARVNHHRVSGNIYRIFSSFLKGRKCEPFQDGVGVILSDTEQYIPDMMVVCDPDKVQDKGVVGAPDLVVEVLSPGTAKNDRGHKKDVYERYGVREYWIVNPADLTVEQYVLTDGKFVLREVYHKYTASWLADMKEEERAAVVTEFHCTLFDDLTIRLDDIFGRVVTEGR